MNKTVIIIVSILVLAGVGVGIYFLVKNGGSKCDPKCAKNNEECKKGDCVCKDGFSKDTNDNCVSKCTDTSCGTNEVCKDGTCVSKCTDTSCGTNEVCKDGTCVAKCTDNISCNMSGGEWVDNNEVCNTESGLCECFENYKTNSHGVCIHKCDKNYTLRGNDQYACTKEYPICVGFVYNKSQYGTCETE